MSSTRDAAPESGPAFDMLWNSGSRFLSALFSPHQRMRDLKESCLVTFSSPGLASELDLSSLCHHGPLFPNKGLAFPFSLGSVICCPFLLVAVPDGTMCVKSLAWCLAHRVARFL